MDPDRQSDTPGRDGLSGNDRRALSILERSAAKSGLGLLWARMRFQLVVVWGARLAVSTGLVVCFVAIGVIWSTLSAHLAVAVAGELVLTAGALLLARGVRLWWYWRQVKRSQP